MDARDLTLANRLADAAGVAIRPFFRADFAHEAKTDATPVTEADRAAEAAIRAILDRECPADAIIGEEFGAKDGSSGRSWVIDPIDGTVSFMAGRPIFGTLIALLEDGWPVMGVIDQCINGERWIGATGQSTTLNGKPVSTRVCRDLSDAVLATTGPQYPKTLDQLIERARKVNAPRPGGAVPNPGRWTLRRREAVSDKHNPRHRSYTRPLCSCRSHH